MILLLMVIVLLALAWGLTDMQLSAPIERPEPPMPVVTKKIPPPPPLEVPQTEALPSEPVLPPTAEMPLQPAAEPPPP